MSLSDVINIEDNIVKSKVEVDVDPTDSVPAAVFRSLKNNADKRVLVDVKSGRTWTGSQMCSAVRKAITLWSDVIGLTKGETVAFYCPNSDWHAINLMSVSAVGGIIASGSDTYKYNEFLNVVRDSNACYIIASRDSLSNAVGMQKELPGQVKKVLLLDLDEVSSSSSPAVQQHNKATVTSRNSGVTCDSVLSLVGSIHKSKQCDHLTADASIDPFTDLYSIAFSSGTTGKPKAIGKTHSAYLSLLPLRSPPFDYLPITEDHHVMSCHSHFAHVGGSSMLLLSLLSGSVACVIDSFEERKFLQAVNDHCISSVFSVPSYVTQLVHFARDPVNRSVVSHLNLSSLCDVLIAGEFCPHEISQQFLRLFPSVLRFRQSFGSTESGFATIVPSDMSNESNVLSSGIPSPGFAVKIMPRRDQDQGSGTGFTERKPLARNQVGEICVKGPQMTTGYLNNESANADSFDEDGFFLTSDGGFIDERGMLFVSDRFKEIIKFDGMQVSPAELESILLSHPDVREAAVIGIPHPIHGHVPKAFIVLQTFREDSCDKFPLSSKSLAAGGSGDQDESAAEVGMQTTTHRATTTKRTEDQSGHNPGSIVSDLMDFVSNRVSSYKQIRGGIEILPTFQRTVLGKIDRKFLRSHFSSRETPGM